MTLLLRPERSRRRAAERRARRERGHRGAGSTAHSVCTSRGPAAPSPSMRRLVRTRELIACSSSDCGPRASTTPTTPRCASSFASTCSSSMTSPSSLSMASTPATLRPHRRAPPSGLDGGDVEPGADRVARPDGRRAPGAVRHRPSSRLPTSWSSTDSPTGAARSPASTSARRHPVRDAARRSHERRLLHLGLVERPITLGLIPGRWLICTSARSVAKWSAETPSSSIHRATKVTSRTTPATTVLDVSREPSSSSSCRR